MVSFYKVNDIQDLKEALKERPSDPEALIVYHCLNQCAMNRIFFLESNTTLAAHLNTAGSFLFVPVPLPHLASQDVMDIYDISSAFREKDSILVQDYIFSERAKNRSPSDPLRRLVTNYAQVDALWTRPNN
ncbi:hypothetical protein BGX21_008385 [Mortierella sp. AD011]|nr:hypothetical protein BGX20_008309 [Mortierella sp. AD010]KAF9397898.1 hypothetical protein BGX21_008385 [Mortierella sp. AD011]